MRAFLALSWLVSLSTTVLAGHSTTSPDYPQCDWFLEESGLGAGFFGEDGSGDGALVDGRNFAAFGALTNPRQGRVLYRDSVTYTWERSEGETESWTPFLNLTGTTGADDNRTSSLHAFSSDNIWVGLTTLTPAHQSAGRLVYGFANWDGNTWTLHNVTFHTGQPAGENLNIAGLWGATPNDIWAAERNNAGASRDRFFRWNGTEWNRYPAAPNSFGIRDMDGSSSSNIWAVGGDGGATGTILRWDGATWNVVAAPSSDTLFGVYVISASDVWITGRNGKIFHWNGATWQDMSPAGLTFNMLDAFGDSSDNVYFVGSGNTIFHWDGETLGQEVEIEGGIGDLRRGWIDPATGLGYAVGSDGVIASEGCHNARQNIDIGDTVTDYLIPVAVIHGFLLQMIIWFRGR